MNRRTALVLSLMTGGLFPLASRAFAQDELDDPRPKSSAPPRRKPAAAKPSARGLDDDDLPAVAADEPVADEAGPPGEVRPEPGFTTKTWNIARYTALAAKPNNPEPEQRIIDWIFRRTGSADWHGPKPSMLSASRAQIRAYHEPKMLKKVDDIVKRFNKAYADVLSFRVRFVRAADTRWRYLVHTRLTSLARGAQGQQVWTLSPTDAASVLAQMQQYRGFEVLLDQTFKVVNGQTLTVAKEEKVDFTGGVQRDGAAGFGFQPAAQQLKEHVTLRMSPLLTYDGDALEVAFDLQTNIVRRLIKTSILTRREVGPNDLQIEVPEVTETRINQALANWPIGQTLLISAGVTPGIFEPKNGFYGVPGTKPTDREMLVLLDADTATEARSARREE